MRANLDSRASATGKLVEPFVTAAENAPTATRDQAYQALQTEMNKVGPIIPLLQPAQSVVTTTGVMSNVVPSPLWLLDLDSIQ